MADREKVIRAIDGCINIGDYCNDCDYDGCIFHHGSCEKDLLADALVLLKEQANEYEKGFNDAMLGKQELMYEGTDGKRYKKDW